MRSYSHKQFPVLWGFANVLEVRAKGRSRGRAQGGEMGGGGRSRCPWLILKRGATVLLGAAAAPCACWRLIHGLPSGGGGVALV